MSRHRAWRDRRFGRSRASDRTGDGPEKNQPPSRPHTRPDLRYLDAAIDRRRDVVGVALDAARHLEQRLLAPARHLDRHYHRATGHNTHRGTARPPRPPLIVSSSIEKRGDPSLRSFSGCGRGAHRSHPPPHSRHSRRSPHCAHSHLWLGRRDSITHQSTARISLSSQHRPLVPQKTGEPREKPFVTLWPEMTSPAISPPTIAADDEPSPRANGMRLTTVYCARAGGRAGGGAGGGVGIGRRWR